MKKYLLMSYAIVLSLLCVALAVVPFKYGYIIHESSAFIIFLLLECLGLYSAWVCIRAYKLWTIKNYKHSISISVRWLNDGSWILDHFLTHIGASYGDYMVDFYWKRFLSDKTIASVIHTYKFKCNSTSYPAGILTISNELCQSKQSKALLIGFERYINKKIVEWEEYMIKKEAQS